MSELVRTTYVKLTETRRKLVRSAINEAHSADPKVLLPIIKADLSERYKDFSAEREEQMLKKMGIVTDEDIVDLVESYLAAYEDELIAQGVLRHSIGSAIRDKIKIKNNGGVKKA